MKKFLLISNFLLISLVAVSASADIIKIKPKDSRAQQWTQFVEDLYALHLKKLEQHQVEKKVRVGGYSNEPDFYNENTYYDKTSGKILSRVQWERANPDNLHAIEVYTYDKNGSLIKDYSAAYLTTHRNAPIQTLNTIHYYNKDTKDTDLHGFRSFNASNERIYEVCKGTFKGKKVRLSLDDDYGEIAEALEDPKGIMSSPLYQACFGSREFDKTKLAIE